MRKKALIITYYWPPAGGPGVQRWLKFVKYLPEFNVDPIVYIPENPNYPILDHSLIHEVNPTVTLLKNPIKEPYKMAQWFSSKTTKTISKGIISETEKQSIIEKILLFVRGNFFIPDARKLWVKPSVNYLSEYLKNNTVDVIITTGPPHSLHLIGLQLQQQFKIKWIADFRDPWTHIGYHKQLRLTQRAQQKHKLLEAQVLNTAHQIIVTSISTKTALAKITNTPIAVITNGYDYEPKQDFNMDAHFSLSHIGSLLSKRNPELLWQVLNELIQENITFAADFKLHLIGAVSNSVKESIANYNLSQVVIYNEYVTHSEAIKYQRQSQLLLLIEIDSEETKCIIPGKLFEYMASNRPIIAIGPTHSDVETIIKETNTGHYFNYTQAQSLKAQILADYKAFKNNALNVNAIGIQQYSRKKLTEKLATLV